MSTPSPFAVRLTVANDGDLALQGGFGGVRTVGGFGPEHLGVAREPLVQPDVLPAGGRDAVAKPLVGHFMGDGPLVHRRTVVADHALRLERGIERGVREDGVAERGEGIGPEELRRRPRPSLARGRRGSLS